MISSESSAKIISAVEKIKSSRCETVHFGVLTYNDSVVGVRIIVDKVTASAILSLQKSNAIAHRFFDINPKNCQVAFDFTFEGIPSKYVDALYQKRKIKGFAVYKMELNEKGTELVCHESGKDILEIEKPKLKTVILKSLLREE